MLLTSQNLGDIEFEIGMVGGKMAATALEVFIPWYVIQISKLNAVLTLNQYGATNVMHILFNLL
jgi:hypothetical protein